MASVAVHVVAVAVLLKGYSPFAFAHESPRVVVAVVLPRLAPSGAEPPPAPARGRQTVVPQVTPSAVVTLPVTPLEPIAPAGDSAGVRGGTPGSRGLAMRPGRGDPRLYVNPLYIPEGGGRPIDLDSVVRLRMLSMADLADSLARYGSDSLSASRPPYRTPSWTFERNGRTYGIDQQWIHLGAIKIPTMLLGLIPNLPQGNIDQARANARLNDMRADILRAAARSEAEEDFRRAVAQIRERKDRERQEQRQREEQQRRETRDNDRPIP